MVVEYNCLGFLGIKDEQSSTLSKRPRTSSKSVGNTNIGVTTFGNL